MFGHQHLAEHLSGHIARGFRRFHEMHAALETIFKSAFPAATGVDLGLHHQVLHPEPLGGIVGFLGGGGDFPFGAWDLETVKKLFGLVFVNIHDGS